VVLLVSLLLTLIHLLLLLRRILLLILLLLLWIRLLLPIMCLFRLVRLLLLWYEAGVWWLGHHGRLVLGMLGLGGVWRVGVCVVLLVLLHGVDGVVELCWTASG
jgi:hypothetical protein